ATLLDTLPATYEQYIGPLGAAEKDRYCLEASGMGPLLGVPDGYLPQSMAALRAYMDEMYASGDIVVTETAKALARELLHPPLPPVIGPLLRPLLWLAQLPTIGGLPPAIREAYGFSWSARHEAALRLSTRVIRALTSVTPPALRYWPAARTAFRRAGKYRPGG
ncbi:MAG: DUF2236 domain-containing protein, partial [Chloroflexi bacterium]|nr:DUF2236 domain-containing protein [Chloroflexota bacterium]